MWRSNGELMEKFRAEDLRSMNENDGFQMFESIAGQQFFPPRHDDGMLEQQRRFPLVMSCPN